MKIFKEKMCSNCGKKSDTKLCKKCQMALEDKLDNTSQTHNSSGKVRVLFYDIETTPIKAWIWRVGEQVITHQQLDDDFNSTGIICISYKWNDNKPARVIGWGYNEQDTESVIRRFDSIASRADVVIGKNSDKFDIRHINAQRMIANLPGLPNYLNNMDDLEAQFRKNFWLPSYSLDYLSKALLKSKGKIRVGFQTWLDIVNKTSRESYRKMLSYCKNDVEETYKLWNFAKAHFKPKFNMATHKQMIVCRNCGSNNIKKNGTRHRGKAIYQMFFCNNHGGFAGEAPINLRKGTFGKIG